jgi:hypothetical protein
MSAAPEKVETTNNEEDTTIDIRDIAKMRHIIDVASSRGTFQGKELTIVGELYNKLDNAVKLFEKEMAEYKEKQPDIDDSAEVASDETE